MENKFSSGVLEDLRSDEEKLKDHKAEELFSAAPSLNWPTWDEWKNAPENQKMLNDIQVSSQDGSSSCLAQATAGALAVDNMNEEGKFRRMSARSIYPFRANKPGLGMNFDDAGRLATKRGVLFEDLAPSQEYGEDKMNDTSDFLPSFEQIAKIYRAKNYLWLPNNIDWVAGIADRKKSVVLGVRFGNGGEWPVEVPQITNATPVNGHGIFTLPKAYFIYNGKKSVLIQDSWGVNTGMAGRRILTEDWFGARMMAAIYFENLANLEAANGSMPKPTYRFTVVMRPGQRSEDIAMMQRCLGYLQDSQGYLFPLDTPPTGLYGGITRAGVKRFQALQGVPVTGECDIITIGELNKIFS